MKAKAKTSLRVKLLILIALGFTVWYLVVLALPSKTPQKTIEALYEANQHLAAQTATLDKGQLRQGIVGVVLALEGTDVHPHIHGVSRGGAAIDAGLKPGSYLTKLDGISTAAMSEAEWVKNLRGIAGTPVTLTLSDKDMGGTESDITLLRRPISKLATRVDQYSMVQNDGGTMGNYISFMPALLNKYDGMQILEFYDAKTGPSDVPPSFKNTEHCFQVKHASQKGVLIRRFDINEPVGKALAKRLQIHKVPAYYFAPHGAREAEPNRLETLPRLHKQYRPVCDHGVEAAPGQWTKTI